MKKILAIITLVAMLFSLAPVAFAEEKYYDCDMSAEFKLELNDGLDYLTEMSKEVEVDVNSLFTELLKAEYTMDVKAHVREDFLKGTLYTETYTNVPICFSDDLKISVDSKFRVWVDYDFSSEETFLCKVVFVNPLNGKYTYVDMSNEELNAEEDFKTFKKELVEGLKKINLKQGSEEIATVVKNVLEGKAKIEKTEDGCTKVTFTDDALVESLFELFDSILKADYIKNVFEMLEEDLPEYDAAEFEQAKTLVKGLGIFADDAYTLKVKADNFGKVSEMEETVHIQCNLYEIAEAMGADMEYEEEYITKENTDIDVKLISNVKFNNAPVVIEMPTLTEENSVDYLDQFFEDYILPEETYAYIPEKFSNSAAGAVIGSDIYVDAQYFIDNSAYDSDNLTGNITVDENMNVTMVLSNDYMAPVKIEGAIGADTYKINGVEEKGVIFVMADARGLYSTESNEVLCVNTLVLTKVLDCTVRSMTTTFADYSGFTYEKPVVSVYLTRPNMGYNKATD